MSVCDFLESSRAIEKKPNTTNLSLSLSLLATSVVVAVVCGKKEEKKTQMMKMLMMKKMKRKDLELDEFSDDFSDFSLSAPARKIRRLVLFSFFPTFFFFVWVFSILSN